MAPSIGILDDHLEGITPNGAQIKFSKRYGWSTHNCSCNSSKTGIVLYPNDTKHKNIVLLLCRKCYGYKENGDTQHQQLLNWYYGQYGDSKQFRTATGFCQRENGELGYNSITLNEKNEYGLRSKEMLPFEQNVVKIVVDGKLNSYIVGTDP